MTRLIPISVASALALLHVSAVGLELCRGIPAGLRLMGPAMSVPAAETESLAELRKEAGRVPQVPMGFANADWERFKTQHVREGDKLQRYAGSALGGYLLLRNGCLVSSFNTVVVN